MAFALAFTHCTKGVDGLSALRDDEEECVCAGGEITVAEFGGDLDFGGNAGEGFEEVFADHGGMGCGAAAGENDAIHGAKLLGRHVEATEFCCGFIEREAATNCIFDGLRLVVDLLEHVVREIAKLCIFGVILDFLHFECRSTTIESFDREVFSGKGD